MPQPKTLTLNDLKSGTKALIVDVKAYDDGHNEANASLRVLIKRLKDLGFSAGEEVHLLGRAFAWGGKGALRVLVGQTHIALRADEARHVLVSPLVEDEV